MFERVVDEQSLTNFLQVCVPDSQFGFRKRCGADDYSIVLSTKLHMALEAKLEAILVALDVAGAFDKVWWKALLVKLHKCG